MINIPLLKQRVLRLIQGRKTYQELSEKQWELCPAESTIATPALYIPEELNRVTDVHPETTYDYEMRRIQGGRKEHGATIAHLLRDAYIHTGFVYKGASKLPLIFGKESWFSVREAELISKAALGCSWSGNRYFGHWLSDDLTTILAAQALAPTIRVTQKLTPHQVEYANFLETHTSAVVQAKCRELIVISDVGQNKYKQERYQTLRSRLKRLSSTQSIVGAFFVRGTSGKRRLLVNEDEVIAFFRGQGFAIVDPEKMTAEEIIRQSLGARIAVGVEGSQLMHSLFTVRDQGAILALQPPNRFNNVFKDYTDCLGLKYAFLVGKQVTDGFEIDRENLVRILDEIDRAID